MMPVLSVAKFLRMMGNRNDAEVRRYLKTIYNDWAEGERGLFANIVWKLLDGNIEYIARKIKDTHGGNPAVANGIVQDIVNLYNGIDVTGIRKGMAVQYGDHLLRLIYPPS